MPPSLLISVSAGLLSAVFYAAAASGSVLSLLTVYISPLPLFMVGLSYGGTAALIGGLCGTVALSLIDGPSTGLAYFLANAAAPIVLTRVALWSRSVQLTDTASEIEWYPTGLMFVWLSGLGIMLIIAFALVLQTFDGGLSGWIQQALPVDLLTKILVDAQQQAGRSPVDENVMRQNLTWFALPGLALFWSLIAIGNGALAQRFLVRLRRNLRPSPELVTMTLPVYWLVPLIIGGLMTAIPGDIGLTGGTIAILAAIPYFFLGLATVHVISHRLPARVFALTVFYILLMALGWPFLLITGLGIVEHFVNYRRTFLATDSR